MKEILRGSLYFLKIIGCWLGSVVVHLILTGTVSFTVPYTQIPAGYAQMPAGFSSAVSEKEMAQEGQPAEAAVAELREKRTKANAELEAVTQQAKKDPSGLQQPDLHEKRSLLEQIVRGYDEQIHDVERLQDAQQRLAEIARTSSEWKGFPDPPPYSILLTDQLWDTVFSLRLAVEGLQSQVNLIELRFDRGRESLAGADEEVRQASEQLEAVTDPAQAARHRVLRDLAELRRRAAAVLVSAAETAKKRVEEELAEARARLAFAERQLDAAEQQVRFSDEDMEKVRQRLSEERQALEEELERTMADQGAHSQALEAALTGASKKDPKQRSARTRAAVELKRTQLDNLIVKGDLVKQLVDVVEGERQLWESRFAIMRDPNPAHAREAYAKFAPLFAHFQASRDHLRQQLLAASGRIGELENRLDHVSRGEDRRYVQAMLQAYRGREAAYNRSLRRMDEAAGFLERWKSEFKEQRREMPLSARIDDWAHQAWNVTKDAWNFEVFTAEDTIEVDGKKITGHRSVTFGKIVTALVILLIGYWLCLYLARVIGRLAITRFGMSAGVANLLRQWTQAFLITILIVISLVSVKIPLTIFAFLGGAFAIGVGFGAQNLLKNVISGILVLIERPLRVGDLIEVDNVRGRVTTIGLRSSTVRDAKGMDTLIPNSNFLERNLTNWTYSSQQSRFSLRLGAPYGSSTREIVELLSAVAKEHPRILKTPPPQILLEEFGAQGRIFTLNYWLEIRLDVDPNEVASELRFAIEERFAKAGLKVLPAA